MRCDKQVAIITGSAQGIGECAARYLAREGCTVVLTDVRQEKIDILAESLNRAGFKASAYKMDTTRASEVDVVVSRVIERYGRIDILVHSAGIYTYSPFLEMKEAEFDNTIRVNLKGTFLCCQRVAREMARNNHGRIICLASAAGQRGGSVGRAHYGASKGGVIAMCKTMANELGPLGITVNAIAPGLIHTDMTDDRIAASNSDTLVKSLAIKRLGQVEDVAGAVVFLASKDADYITGATIDINGGGLMR